MGIGQTPRTDDKGCDRIASDREIWTAGITERRKDGNLFVFFHLICNINFSEKMSWIVAGHDEYEMP